MTTRTAALLGVFVMSFLALPAIGQDDLIELTRPKGPGLYEKANKEWGKFEKTLPSWFTANIKYTGNTVWGTHTELSGFYKDNFWVAHDEIFWKENGKCWMEERTTIEGDLNTIRYGTMKTTLDIEPASRKKMRNLHDAAERLAFAKSLEELVEDSPGTSILKELAGQIPIFGKAFGNAEAMLDAVDKIEKFNAIQAALGTFLKEYSEVERMITRRVVIVTVNGGYDEAVLIKGERKEVHTESKTTEQPCEGKFWEQVEEGQKYEYHKYGIPIKGEAAEKLAGILRKVKADRDYTKLLIEVRKSLTGHWIGVATWPSTPTESTPLDVEFQAPQEGVVFATFTYGADKKQDKMEMQVAQKDWYERTFVFRETQEEADKITKLKKEKGYPFPHTTYKAEISPDGATITGYELDKWGDKVYSFTLHRK